MANKYLINPYRNLPPPPAVIDEDDDGQELMSREMYEAYLAGMQKGRAMAQPRGRGRPRNDDPWNYNPYPMDYAASPRRVRVKYEVDYRPPWWAGVIKFFIVMACGAIVLKCSAPEFRPQPQPVVQQYAPAPQVGYPGVLPPRRSDTLGCCRHEEPGMA